MQLDSNVVLYLFIYLLRLLLRRSKLHGYGYSAGYAVFYQAWKVDQDKIFIRISGPEVIQRFHGCALVQPVQRLYLPFRTTYPFVYWKPIKAGYFSKNSEDPDEMPQNAAFHQGLHRLPRSIQYSRTEVNNCSEISTNDPLNLTVLYLYGYKNKSN